MAEKYALVKEKSENCFLPGIFALSHYFSWINSQPVDYDTISMEYADKIVRIFGQIIRGT